MYGLRNLGFPVVLDEWTWFSKLPSPEGTHTAPVAAFIGTGVNCAKAGPASHGETREMPNADFKRIERMA